MSDRRFQPPMVLFAYNVARDLRIEFKLSRKESEWLCFRQLGLIHNNHHARVEHMMCAQTCFVQWKQGLEREYLDLR